MDVGSLIGYAPVAIGTIILGVITNRADKGIDVVRNIFASRKSARRAKETEDFERQVRYLSVSRYTVPFYISEASLATVVAIFGAALSTSAAVVIFLTAKGGPGETSSAIVYIAANIGEYVGVYFVSKGMFRLNKLWRIYNALASLELDEARQAHQSNKPEIPSQAPGP